MPHGKYAGNLAPKGFLTVTNQNCHGPDVRRAAIQSSVSEALYNRGFTGPLQLERFGTQRIPGSSSSSVFRSKWKVGFEEPKSLDFDCWAVNACVDMIG